MSSSGGGPPNEGSASYLDAGDEWSSEPRGRRTAENPVPVPPSPPTRTTSSFGNRAAPRSTEPSVGAPGPAQPRSGAVRARGVARNVQVRYDTSSSEDVLAFRLDQYDQSGNRLDPIAVEMRGLRLRGQISEGEEVEAVGEWQRGTLIAREVRNVTTSAEVSVWSWRSVPAWVKVAMVAVPLIIVAVIAVVVLQVSSRGSGPVPIPDVVGKEGFFAEGDVERSGFIPQEREEASETMPAGRVIRTEPPVGTTPGKGALVTIVVSTGSAKAQIPNVVGKEALFAMADLARAGFQPRQRDEPSATVPASQVIRTEPPAGTTVDRNAAVTVVVSTGRARR